MSLFVQSNNFLCQYFLERENKEVIEFNHGFLVFKRLCENEIFITDIYVDRSKRNLGEAHKMADCLVKKYCPKVIFGMIDLRASNGSEASAITMLKYGFKFHEIQDKYTIVFKKVIQWAEQ